MQTDAAKTDSHFFKLILALGLFSFVTVLAYHNLTDGDLWAKLALGASLWQRGDLIRHDIFAFTPVLPKYIDHEWGAGFIFYVLILWLGPSALMLLKISLALGTLALAAAIARLHGGTRTALYIFSGFAAIAILPGYVPVIRSHAFTYFFFALALFCLEKIRRGHRCPVWVLIPLMLVWANVHGGFVAGLGTIGVYTAFAILTKQHAKLFLFASIGSFLATFINPYGIDFWGYLIPALLHPRDDIAEWHPLSLFANDAFIGFRVLFLLVAVVVVLGWKKTSQRSWPGLFMLALTAYLGWKSRRHAPFFAAAAVAFATPFLETLLLQLGQIFRNTAWQKCKPIFPLLTLYGAGAIFVSAKFLPEAALHPLSPVGHDAVRETDILMFAQAEGNLAVPFGWGSYCSWRLFPRIKVSMDGRYEAAYPESTFRMNEDFFRKRGVNWDRLVRDFPVDYVILDFKTTLLRPEDLLAHGYVLIWQSGHLSALLAKKEKVSLLEKAVRELPPRTIEPLDAAIPKTWWN